MAGLIFPREDNSDGVNFLADSPDTNSGRRNSDKTQRSASYSINGPPSWGQGDASTLLYCTAKL